jgi:serine protease Do
MGTWIQWFPRLALGCGLFVGVLGQTPGAHGADRESALHYAKALSAAFRKAAEAASPAVVTVVATSKAQSERRRQELRDLLQDPRWRRLFPDGALPDDGKDDESPLDGLDAQVGSGVVIDPAGIILTNNHVVDEADDIVVRFPDGRELKATEVKADPLSDLAIIRAPSSEKLPAAKLGDSAELSIGDWVIAIGSPFELETTVSAGIISGKGRGIDKIQRGKLIQTDAAINPGNSGGPLVNLDGEVVGINTAIASMSGGYQGIGFAIPINRAKWVSQELLQRGSVRRAGLGIRIDELKPEAAKKLRLPPRSGVYVAYVMDKGPADEAGIRTNDVIVEFAGVPVRGPRDLQDEVEQRPIDSKQKVKVMRDGKALELSVTLKPLPQERDAGKKRK